MLFCDLIAVNLVNLFNVSLFPSLYKGSDHAAVGLL
jgi:hypothetical protein